MIDDGIIVSNNAPRVVESLVEENLTVEDMTKFETLKSIDIEVEQAEYIQTLG